MTDDTKTGPIRYWPAVAAQLACYANIPDVALLAPEPDGIRLPSDASGASNGAAGI